MVGHHAMRTLAGAFPICDSCQSITYRDSTSAARASCKCPGFSSLSPVSFLAPTRKNLLEACIDPNKRRSRQRIANHRIARTLTDLSSHIFRKLAIASSRLV